MPRNESSDGDNMLAADLRERLVRPLAEFGNYRLDDLGRSVADIAAWQARLPKGYRPKIFGAFAQVLDRAVAWRIIRENPVRLARTGKRRGCTAP